MNRQLETTKKFSSQNEFCTVPTTDNDTQVSKHNQTACGIGMWRPRWLQFFATQKFYIMNYCILSILQGAYLAYFIGIVSTVEKRFSFKSKISGLILMTANIAAVLIVLIIGYFNGKSHRPKWIAGSILMTVVSCFLSAVPYFVYGKDTHLFVSRNHSYSMFGLTDYDFCEHNPIRSDNCDKIKEFTSESAVAISLFFVASFLEGIGSSGFYSLGTPYLNDNIKQKDSSLYLSSIYSLRLFGPSVGFILASICLRYYEDPVYDPGFDNNDPRWIGAWWIGFVVLAILLLFFSLPMFLFPNRLAGGKIIMQNQIIPSSIIKVKEMLQGLKRLFKNPLFVCHTVSVTFRLMGSFGYYIFMPKYIESQFGQSASNATFFTGSTTILSILVSILGGWYLIRKFSSKPRKLTGYSAIMEIFTFFGIISLLLFGCYNRKMPGISQNSHGMLLNDCNKGCECSPTFFKPVCGPDGASTYFSPCFAGCTGINNTIDFSVYTNCKCLYDDKQVIAPSDALEGFCTLNCNTFLPYIIILSLSTMISSTARFGNSLITLRCVESRDKSLALIVMGTVLSTLVFIPYSILFGSVSDSSCLIWEEQCGKVGNCWIYDSDKFRYYLHSLSAFLILIGVIFDFAVFYMSDKVKGFFNGSDDLPPVDLSKLPIEGDEEDIIYCKIPEYNRTMELKT